MSFISVLEKIGDIGKEIFKVAAEAEPIVNVVFPTIAPFYDMIVTLITNVESAAAASSSSITAAQRKTLVLASFTPYAVAKAPTMGIVTPTAAQLSTYYDHVLAEHKLFQAL